MKKDKWKIASLDKAISGSDDEDTDLGSYIGDEKNCSPEEIFLKKISPDEVGEKEG